MIYFDRYKDGKLSILTMSYDDGHDADVRLVEIFNRYGIKGTFNLNSVNYAGKSDSELAKIRELYAGHEISCHTVNHCRVSILQDEDIFTQAFDDRKALEKIAGYIVRGMAYPYGEYTKNAIDIFKKAGIVYSRTINNTNGFSIPENFMEWNPTCHHDHCLEQADRFIDTFKYPWRYPLFYVWGHSFEFKNKNNWDIIERFCDKMAGKENIWYATNMEIYEYVTALRQLVISADSKTIFNPTSMKLWFSNNGETYSVEAGQTITI